MDQESDPLLPRYARAPEVDTGSRIRQVLQPPYHKGAVSSGEGDEASPNITRPIVKGLITIFSSVVLLALIIALLASPSRSPGTENPRDGRTIHERVEKILSETPLIGHHHVTSSPPVV